MKYKLRAKIIDKWCFWKKVDGVSQPWSRGIIAPLRLGRSGEWLERNAMLLQSDWRSVAERVLRIDRRRCRRDVEKSVRCRGACVRVLLCGRYGWRWFGTADGCQHRRGELSQRRRGGCDHLARSHAAWPGPAAAAATELTAGVWLRPRPGPGHHPQHHPDHWRSVRAHCRPQRNHREP